MDTPTTRPHSSPKKTAGRTFATYSLYFFNKSPSVFSNTTFFCRLLHYTHVTVFCQEIGIKTQPLSERMRLSICKKLFGALLQAPFSELFEKSSLKALKSFIQEDDPHGLFRQGAYRQRKTAAFSKEKRLFFRMSYAKRTTLQVRNTRKWPSCLYFPPTRDARTPPDRLPKG